MNNKFLLINLLLGMFMLMPVAALADEIPVAVFSDDGKTMTFTYADEAKVDSKTVFKLGDWTWKAEIDTLVEKVVFDQSFAKARPTSTESWFNGFVNLTSMKGIEKLNTSEVTNMRWMFRSCSSLKNLDLSSFHTEKVTDMGEMLLYCSSLKSVDLSGFKTDNVVDLYSMFSQCSSLRSIDVSGFNTANANRLDHMFAGCSSLTSLDVSGFNTAKVTQMYGMFDGCSSLKGINVSNFQTDNMVDIHDLFKNCSSLKSLDVSNFVTNRVTNMSRMFEDCSSLTSLDVSKFNTKNVTDMSNMFNGCSKLTTLDVSGFNTENVTDMNRMFMGCFKLTSLDVSGFNTAKVSNMSDMFHQCISVAVLDVSNFKTDNVTGMADMFADCSSVKELDLSGFNTSNVTSMNQMFAGCSSLKSLDISNFNTDKVTGIGEMLTGTNLEELNVGNNSFINVSNVSRAFMDVGSTKKPCLLTVGSDFDKSVLGDVQEGKYYKWLDGYFSADVANDTADLDNTIYCNNAEARTGKQVTLSFRMKNLVKIRGFQFDLHLPDGFSVAKKANGQDSIAMSTARDAKDNINYLGSRMQTARKNVYRVLATSTENLSVAEGDDEILTLTLDVADSLTDGNYALVMDSIKLVDDDLNGIKLDDVMLRSFVVVHTFTLADVNGDGSIDVTDFAVTSDYILGGTPKGFVVKAADINGDGTVDVIDLAAVADMVLKQGMTSSAASAKKAPFMAKRKDNASYTDPSTLDNVVYLNDTEGETGKQLKLTFRMKNSVKILGFQFDLHLPDGFTGAKKSNGLYDVAMCTARNANVNIDFAKSNMVNDHLYRVLASSTQHQPVAAGDDDIVTVILDVADSVAAGDYTFLMDNIVMTDDDLQGIKLTGMTFKSVVKLVQSFDGVVLDENSTTAPVASDGDVNVKAKLTIKGGEWTTICLPFAMTGEQVAEAFGSDVMLADYTGWDASYASDDDDDPESITVNFSRVAVSEGMKANHPYAIKTTQDVSEFVVSGVAVSPETEPSVTTGSRRKGTLGSFTGSYVADFTVPAQSLYLDGGKFVYSTGSTTLKAFHAYFDFQGVTTSYGSDVSNVSSSFGESTGITGISNAETKQNVYSIGGVLVSKSGMKNLPKGIYVSNGKKIVVK